MQSGCGQRIRSVLVIMSTRLTETAHRFLEPVLTPGCVALDATLGAGADTAFLAARVGPTGRVHAFDIQQAALARAQQRLVEADLADRVVWHVACHSRLCDHVGADRFAAAAFNLGWLPGGSRDIVTRPDTTVAALAATAARLAPGGRLSVLAYRAHAGGSDEAAAVARWVERAEHGLEQCACITSGSEARPGPVFHGLTRPVGNPA